MVEKSEGVKETKPAKVGYSVLLDNKAISNPKKLLETGMMSEGEQDCCSSGGEDNVDPVGDDQGNCFEDWSKKGDKEKPKKRAHPADMGVLTE